MRRALLALTLLAACKISDAHFKGTELPDGPRGDSMTDGSPAMPRTHGYLVDASAGITLMAKDPATGALTGITQLMTAAPLPYNGAVVSKSGTYLFLFTGDTAAGSMVTTLVIGSDGRTTDASTFQLPMCTQPLYPQLDATGKYMLVSCLGGVIQELRVAADGTVTLGSNLPFNSPNGHIRFTLAGTGTCGFALDNSIAPSKLLSFTLDPMSGALGGGQSTSLQQPASDVAATNDGNYVYVAGTSNNASVFEYVVSAGCNVTPNLANTSVGSPPSKIAVEPTGKYVYVAGARPYSFVIGPNGLLSSNAAGNGSYNAIVEDLVFDPEFPAMGYAVLSGYVIAEPITPDGVLQGGVVYPGNGMKAVAFVMAP